MNRTRTASTTTRPPGNAGMTLVEIMFASVIWVVIVMASVSIWIWTLRMSNQGKKRAAAQYEANVATQQMVMYIRRGMNISALDPGGSWVEVTMPNGDASRFIHTNASLVFRRTPTSPDRYLISNGVTRITSPAPLDVFVPTLDNSNHYLRIYFRNTERGAGKSFAVEVNTSVRLRNFDDNQ